MRILLNILLFAAVFLGIFGFVKMLNADDVVTMEIHHPKNTLEIIGYFADKYHVSKTKLTSVAKCESGLRHDGVYGDKGLAYGIFQFHEGTFNAFKKEMGLPQLSYTSKVDQIRVAAWAFSMGKAKHWTCARMV